MGVFCFVSLFWFGFFLIFSIGFHIQATGSAIWQKLTMLGQAKTEPEIISFKITKQQQLKGGKERMPSHWD